MTIKSHMENETTYPNKRQMMSTMLVGLTVLLCLVLTCTSAFAATLTWEEYAKEMRTLEEEIGFYADWPIVEKEALVQALIDMGYLNESSATNQLLNSSISQENKHALADQILMLFLGGDRNALVDKDGVRSIRWNTINSAILGDISSLWTPTQRVWYQEVTNMYREGEDIDTLILPNADDLPEEEVIAIARDAIIKANGLAQDELDCFMPEADLYIINHTDDLTPDTRYWSVSFCYYVYGDEENPTILNFYSTTIDEKGNVIEP